MTRYGTLIGWAKQLGRNGAATLLNQTLDEEKATDKKLTEMAESKINRKTVSALGNKRRRHPNAKVPI
jgi:ferritin-like metal-binding protein YciE